MFRFFIAFTLLGTLFLSSCKEDNKLDMFANVKGTYFSVKQFSLDEWQTHAGEPIVFKQTVTLNGKTDTSYVNIEQLDWRPILKTFVETDISDRKFLGQYTFNQFDDATDNTHNFMYVANNKNLFTQKLLITMDVNSMKVRGVYIETYKKSIWNERIQKLYYAPVKIIQIQQYDHPLVGSKKELVTTYDAIPK